MVCYLVFAVIGVIVAFFGIFSITVDPLFGWFSLLWFLFLIYVIICIASLMTKFQQKQGTIHQPTAPAVPYPTQNTPYNMNKPSDA